MSWSRILFRNGLWLWAVPMTLSLALWDRLGPSYQPAIFWADIPPFLAMTENASRIVVVAISSLFVFGMDGIKQKWGLILYLVGLEHFRRRLEQFDGMDFAIR